VGKIIKEDSNKRVTGYWFLDDGKNHFTTMTHIVSNGSPICNMDIIPEWEFKMVAVIPSLQLNACSTCKSLQIAYFNTFGSRTNKLVLRLGM